MNESKIEAEANFLKIFEGLAPTPLIRARLELSYAPVRIKDCLEQTLERDEKLMKNVQNEMRVSSEEEVYSQLLHSITRAWAIRHRRNSGLEGVDINPEVVPDALFDFRLKLNRFGVPISGVMERTIMEAHRDAMQVMREDIKLLEEIAQAYDNNPNFRHKVGMLTAFRDMGRSGDIFAGRDVYRNKIE